MQLQQTLKKCYSFEGKGLHTGRSVTMVLEPAPANHGIKFKRVDIGEDAIIDALVDYVTTTARGTTLEKGEVKISTLEHLMATFNGLGIESTVSYQGVAQTVAVFCECRGVEYYQVVVVAHAVEEVECVLGIRCVACVAGEVYFHVGIGEVDGL